MNAPRIRNALDGLRVLDLTHYLAGPYCTKLLCDYGAEVLKIERPGRGDGARRLGPFFDGDEADREPGALFTYLNADKLGLTLDLGSAPGVELFRRLLKDADVVVESFRPGTMERFGLSYAELARLKPSIVLCSISSFGHSGPYRDRVPSELVLQSMGGLVHLTGDPKREPIGIPMPLTQYVAGLQAYLATLAAEGLAKACGEGEHLDVSILEAFLSLQDSSLATYAYSGDVPQRKGYLHQVAYPGGAYPCRDGFVWAFASLPEDWRVLCEVIGRPELSSDPRFQIPLDRQAHATELDAALAEWITPRTTTEIYHTMQGRRVPFAIIATAKELLESPHLLARDSFETFRCGNTSIRMPGAPFRIEAAPRVGPRKTPMLGQHNEHVYVERLGLSRAELAGHAAAGVI